MVARAAAAAFLGSLAVAVLGAVASRGEAERGPLEERGEQEVALRGELGEWTSWQADPAGPGPGGWAIEWSDGLRVGRRDRATELLFGGELMLDAGTYHFDPGVRPGGDGWGAGTELRRMRVFAQGIVMDSLIFRLSYDLADEELKDAYIGVRDLGPIRALVVGQLDEPFSLEKETSLRNQPFLERSLASSLAPSRSLGLLGTGVLFDARLRWAVGAFARDDSRRQADDAVRGYDEDPEIALRVSGLPVWREGGRTMLLIGASLAHAFVDPDETLYLSPRPETQLVSSLVSTGPVEGVDAIERVGLELAAVRGPLWLQAEWVANRYDRASGDLDPWGGSLRLGWILTGEHRPYGRSSGVFGSVVPSRPFSIADRHYGAFEVAGRLSHLDLGNRSVAGGRELNLTLSLNWFPRAHVRVGTNWVHAHVHGRGALDVVEARLQIDL